MESAEHNINNENIEVQNLSNRNFFLHHSNINFSFNLQCFKIENGIQEFLDSGRKSWTLDSERWTLDAGL